MKTSRERLLDYLNAHHPLTAIEISQALRMTEANARHHLGILQSQGLVAVTGKRPAGGKGRPLLLYSPSEQALGDNLGSLAEALLEELVADLPRAEQSEALARLARRMVAQTTAPRQGPVNLTQRLFSTVQQLNNWRYQARWEAHAGGARLVLGHCPYAAILPEHPECCTLDALLLERLLNKPVEQVARLAQDARGLPHCIFRLLQ